MSIGKRTSVRIGIFISFFFILVNLIGLDRSPIVWIDEVTTNDPAKELTVHGILRSSVFGGESSYMSTYLWVPPAQPLVTAFVYELFGFGIWQTRIPPLFFAALTLYILCQISFHIFMNVKAAAISAILFGLDPQFIQMSRAARMDAQCLFFLMAGLYLFLLFNSSLHKRTVYFLLSGLMCGLAVMTNPVCISWIIALLIIMALELKTLRVFNVLIYGIAGALPVFLWLIFAFKTPQEFQMQFLAHVGDHIPEQSIAIRFIGELSRYVHVYSGAFVLLIFYVISCCWVLCTKTLCTLWKKRLIILFIIPFIFNAIALRKEIGFYSLYTNVVLCIPAGQIFIDSITWQKQFTPRIKKYFVSAFYALLVINILLSGIAGRLAALMYQWSARDYEQVQTAIRQYIPEKSIVCGPPEIWYAIEKSGSSLRLYTKPETIHPDYVVIKKEDPVLDQNAFEKITDFGIPFPKVFGLIRTPSADYQMQIWKSKKQGDK